MGHIVRFCVCACVCFSTISVQKLQSVVNFVGAGVPRNDMTNLQLEKSPPCLYVAPKFSRNGKGKMFHSLLKWTLYQPSSKSQKGVDKNNLFISGLCLQCHSGFHFVVPVDVLIRRCLYFSSVMWMQLTIKQNNGLCWGHLGVFPEFRSQPIKPQHFFKSIFRILFFLFLNSLF